MIGVGRTDPPTATDRHRLRKARVQAHARVKAIDDEHSAALRTAYREEIGAVVRSASPFLISLLTIEGRTLDDAVMLLEPRPGWPRHLHFEGSGLPGRKGYTHILRHYRAGLLAEEISVLPLDGFRIDSVDDGWIRIEIVGHSIEVSGKMGLVFFETRFGQLRFELIDEMPRSLFIACKGRLIEEVVDHVALRGRCWRIVDIEEPGAGDGPDAGGGDCLDHLSCSLGSLEVGRTNFLDPTTAADRRRLKVARAEARLRVREIRRDGGELVRDVFQQELGTTIRSASPFLNSLAASQGTSLDELAHRIQPMQKWPRAPSLSTRIDVWPARDAPSYFLVSTASGWQKAIRLRGLGHRMAFMQSGDDWAHLEVVNHSLEVEGRIGPVKFETLFGTLRVELDDPIPETLAAACAGRLIGDLIDHASLRGRDWPITRVEDPPSPGVGPTLVVATGSKSYRMPWAR